MSETPKAKIPRKIVKIRYITSKNIYTYKISRINPVCVQRTADDNAQYSCTNVHKGSVGPQL